MILVVGGHSRNIGKTSVVANIIRAMPQLRWTAVKITQFGHGVCSSTGDDCACATEPDHPFALTRERDPASGTDTSRYLAAGAAESLWLRTRAGELGFAIPALRRVLDRSPHTVIESNSVIQFLKPDLYLVVLDPSTLDFKTSSRSFLDRADAFLLPDGASAAPAWPTISPALLRKRPFFALEPDFVPPPALLEFIASRHKVAASASR